MISYFVVLEREGHEILYRPMGNDEGDRFESSGRDLLKHDTTIIALGDGGAHYGMICDAAYTTYLLTYWVRDARGEHGSPLPWAIRKLTSEPAAAMGLEDRGVVAEGYEADLNVIDLDRLRLYAPKISYDRPAGGKRLTQKADGYEATVVSGVVTYRNGVATGAFPGRLVRGARARP